MWSPKAEAAASDRHRAGRDHQRWLPSLGRASPPVPKIRASAEETVVDLFDYEHAFKSAENFSDHLRYFSALKEQADAVEQIGLTRGFIGQTLLANGKLSKWITSSPSARHTSSVLLMFG